MQGLGKGGALSLFTIVQATAEEVHRVYYKPRHKPGYAEAMHYCKAPLWGRRLDLDSLNQPPRFVHRPLLLLWPVVAEKRPHGVP